MPEAAVKGAWKEVQNQSERQLGMFIALHLSETGMPPKLLTGEKTSFRNKVIHQGKMPSIDEAISYGQAVADVVMPLLILLRKNPLKTPAFKLYQQHFLDREAIARNIGATDSAIQPIMTTFYLHSEGNSVDIAARVKEYARCRSESTWGRLPWAESSS